MSDQLASLTQSIATLTATNAKLSEKLLEHEALVLEHHEMKKSIDALQAEASDARADKAALEQEMRLSSAQRSAKRATFLIFHLPFTLGFIFFFVGHACLFLVFGKVWRTSTWVPGMVILAAFTVQCMSIRPTNVRMIRTAACLMGIPGELPPVCLIFGYWIFVGFYEPFRYHARPIAYALSLSLCLEIPVLLFMVLTVFKGGAGEAAQLTGLERQKLTWRWMRETFNPRRTAAGHITAILAMITLSPVVGPYTWQKYCDLPMPPRTIMNKFILVNRMCWHATWGVCHVGVPLYYLLLDDDLLLLPPWFNATGATDAEIAEEAARTRGELYGTMGSGAFFLLCAFVILTPLVRGKVHAWLCQLGSAGEAGRAAGVSALVGKMEPQHALVLARKRFMGLPYSTLRETDFSSNADTGLNGKTRRCRLGGVDAFLSHSWHDSPRNKWRVLEDWARRFVDASGRDPVLWFDKACIFQQGNIDEQLACLPIFLSGCQRLVVLAARRGTSASGASWSCSPLSKWAARRIALDLLPVSSGESGGVSPGTPSPRQPDAGGARPPVCHGGAGHSSGGWGRRRSGGHRRDCRRGQRTKLWAPRQAGGRVGAL